VAEPLLLHSLAELRELIVACLDAAGARSVVEIGGEDGTFTRELASWAEDGDGAVFCVDPAPSRELATLAQTSETITLVRQRSLDALPTIGPCDAYLIDGDHNHHTVLGELEAIEKAHGGGRRWLAILHDVGWPWGRRDLYYDPEGLPPSAVKPHTFDQGVTLGSNATVVGGFRGEGEFACAAEEGGPANGVLTAVEDFLESRPGLTLARVPSVFGLGILYPPEAAWGPAVDAIVAPYHDNPLLQRLERNRLALYLKVLELGDDLGRAHDAMGTQRLHTRDVEVENRALWARVRELEARLAEAVVARDALVREVDAVARARSFKVAERLSRVHAIGRNEPGLSSERLLRLIDSVGDPAPHS
jgi:hypothetical protein